VVLNGTGVSDSNTGFVWERSTDPTARTWDQANTYCNDLTLGGKDDWRFPTKDELLSLVDKTQSNPALPLGHAFINVYSYFYWSSTTNDIFPANALPVHFGDGYVYSYSKTYNMYVRCVRGGQ